jgi:hypothetical protein
MFQEKCAFKSSSQANDPTFCRSRQKREIRCNNKEGADGIQCSKSPKEDKKESMFRTRSY